MNARLDEEKDVYTEEGREELKEEDAIDELEEGFLEGYENDLAECSYCHQVLVDEDFVESEIDGKIMRFCCNACYEEYLKKRK